MMFARLFTDSTLLIWPQIGLVIFLVFFAGVLFYVFYGLRKKIDVERLSALPLEKETIVSEAGCDGRTR